MTTIPHLGRVAGLVALFQAILVGQSTSPEAMSLADLKVRGAAESRYLEPDVAATDTPIGPDLDGFRREIEPVLRKNCYACHGPVEDEGGLRIDALDPNLFTGQDADWWLDVLAVLNNGEMPPRDADVPLADADRSRLVDWLSRESQRASRARRAEHAHTSFRRLTRYEYGYALQDLLGLPFDFAADLPPDPASHEGFENTSETLHLTGGQLRTYLEAGRRALELATFPGERPEPLHWSVPIATLAAREWAGQDQQLDKLRTEHAADPTTRDAKLEELLARFRNTPGGVHFVDRNSGRKARQNWAYYGAKYALAPTDAATPPLEVSRDVAIVPPRQSLIVEIGDRLPERGTLRVRVRAARADASSGAPRMRLIFGWQASNDSRAFVTIGDAARVVDAPPEAPEWYGWDVPLSQIYPRNSVRGVNRLGDLPSPSEYLRIANGEEHGAALQIDHVEITAPVHESWPPPSHRRIFAAGDPALPERERAAAILADFLPRAWRRDVSDTEVEGKLSNFERIRPVCDTFEATVVEVLTAALASPDFLYVARRDAGDAESGQEADRLDDHDLATRLALFLWSSIPDDRLRGLASAGALRDPATLAAEVDRMLADPRAERFAEQFVRQWLNLELLAFLQVDPKVHPGFDAALKRSMRGEPVAFFRELLGTDASVLDLLHAEFAMVDERLARHYGIRGVDGDQFRRVPLPTGSPRGGLLTQAGLLAMNSNGVDSHPIKRGVWLLERILNDPPPPPPAAVPEIDLADPEIAKLTLKQRIEQHRDHAACMSCHARIDPWGFAFENFDALGTWRTEHAGRAIDASGTLFNGRDLDGIDGLKRFLLGERQDQFVSAMVHKLATFALGRPLGFADRAALHRITADVRRRGDGLATIVRTIVASDLFHVR